MTQTKRKIDKLIVHCSASPEGQNVTIDGIRKLHKQRYGWRDIGYHYVIHLDGSIHKGRDESVIGAHVKNQNANSIGICYIGGMNASNTAPKDTRTPAQKEALLKLLKDLKRRYPNATIHGHREFANKACPSFDAAEEYRHKSIWERLINWLRREKA